VTLVAVRSPLAAPDLVYQSCTILPANPTTADEIRAMFTLKNQGNAPAVFPANSTAFKAFSPFGGSISEAVGQTSVAPGTSKNWTYIPIVPAGQGRAGTYDFRVVVDPNNAVSESNEGNNEGICKVTIAQAQPSGQPDLVVSACRFRPTPTPYTSFTMDVDLKNQGTASAVFPVNSMLVNWKVAGREGGKATPGGLTLAPGAMTTVSMGINPGTIASPGTYTVTFKADPGNAIAESNETNNEKRCTVTLVK
jgi:uncharacterized membrane protein